MTIERIRELIERGAPWEACDAFREAAAAAPGVDAALLYWGALAHARSGAAREAHALLDRAQSPAEAAGATALLVEILSLRGRLFKDAVHRRVLRGHPTTDVPVDDGVRALVARARDAYLAAWRMANDPFPGVNVATLSLLLGDRESASRFARDVIARLGPELQSAWDLASLGEARLLLGDVAGATAAYAAAFGACGGNGGTVASMRRQLALIARVVPQAAAVMEAVPAASVVAFAGHMVDAAGRDSPRLPPAKMPALAATLRARTSALRDPIVYTSAACGADLLFIEAAIERGAEVNVVLPFDRDDFVRNSVAIGGDSWVTRFESALAHVHRVVMATDEQYLGDDILFDHAARLVEGYTVLRAEQLQAEPLLVCVADLQDPSASNASARHATGGTLATLARWRRAGRAESVIELGSLEPAVPRPAESSRRQRLTAAAAAQQPRRRRDERTLKSMLFADVAGYSRLHDAVIPDFQRAFLDAAASLIAAADPRPVEAKTWGDGLYLVFDGPRAATSFALAFAERAHRADWPGGVRIALHAGPVFRFFDPVMARDGCFGANVTRAARIEPITPPGLVYASEAFAATLRSDGADDFALEYVGALPLAKGYGESRVYRVERR